MEIKTGIQHTSTLTVENEHTAQTLGSGDLPVLATPAMIALMENAAMEALKPFLEAGQSSVGTSLTTSHDRASGPGETIRATATVTETDGRRVEFEIKAEDSSGNELGKGKHTRFIIDIEKFMSRIIQK